MKYGQLKKIFAQHNIPDDVTLMSDSGWECDATDMDGIFYNEKEKIIVFTQDSNYCNGCYQSEGWKLLYDSNINEN